MKENKAFQNRVNLQNEEDVRPNDCEQCYEPLVFALRNNDAEFSVGLMTVLECLHHAEKEGYVPKLPDGWWNLVDGQYLNHGNWEYR